MGLGPLLGIFALALAVYGDVDKTKQCPKHVIRHDNREIQSPLYGRIPSHFRCWYNITAPEGKIVKLQVLDMDFPAPVPYAKLNKPFTTTCLHDYIEFFDENDASHGRYCGKKNGNTFNFKEQSVKLLFHSYTGTRDKKGFRMKIVFANKPAVASSRKRSCRDVKSCEADAKQLRKRDEDVIAENTINSKEITYFAPRYGAMSCGGKDHIAHNKSSATYKAALSNKRGYYCMWEIGSSQVKGMKIETSMSLDKTECRASQIMAIFLKDEKYLDSKWLSNKCDSNSSKTILFPEKVKKLKTILFGFTTLKADVKDKAMTITLTPQKS